MERTPGRFGQNQSTFFDAPPVSSVAGLSSSTSHNNQHPHSTLSGLNSEGYPPSQVSDISVSAAFPFLYSPSTASSDSRDFPSREGRAEIRKLTREILHLTMPQTREPVVQDTPTLDPTKYDPSRTMDVPIVYNNHSSLSSGTASTGSSSRHVTWKHHSDQSNGQSDSPSRQHHFLAQPNQYTRGLPPSKSEGNVKSFEGRIYEDSNYGNKLYGGWGGAPLYHPEPQYRNQPSMEAPPDEGRGRHRSRSPVKVLEPLDEDVPLELLTQHTPRKRSRSPHKRLFGEGGWLGRSPDFKEEKQKKAGLKGLGERIKQQIGDLTGDVAKSSASAPPQFQPFMKPNVPISIDPPTQARLYSELELMICISANKFLLQQYHEGRMSPESITKVTNFWTSKNRPQVAQFQFDQLTQRDLIIYNIRTFKFYGESARNNVVLNATLYDWKTVAKEMSVRTFCLPDSVVRKHLHDAYKILEMLGSPPVTIMAFQELQVNMLELMRSEDRKKLTKSVSSGGSDPGNWFAEQQQYRLPRMAS